MRGDYLKSGHTTSCGCIKSKGEEKIAKLLRENNIDFIQEKQFNSCIFPNGYLAKFDFYVTKKNYLIEYDGIQQFEEGNFLNANKDYDEIKNKWCKENNIPLIRIPYTHYEKLNIKDLLLETTSFLIESEKYNAE